jgi:hypothetical protein
MPAEVLLKRQRRTLLFATFVQRDNAIARVAWTGIELAYKRIVPELLEQRVRSLRGVELNSSKHEA